MTVPIRWQTTTNEEAYESFNTMHTADVRNIMVEHAKKYKEIYINRPESADRTYRLKYAEEIPSRFPSITWYLEAKPSEVKWMNENTTGLCKVCIDKTYLDTMNTMKILYQMDEAARINYDAVVIAAKRSCVCRTKVRKFIFLLIFFSRSVLTGSVHVVRIPNLESPKIAPAHPAAVMFATLIFVR